MKSIVPLLSCDALSLPATTAADETLDTAVVTGTRRSLESALARKRAAPGIVDSVVADEIHKLPDLSAVDALQRITGVQTDAPVSVLSFARDTVDRTRQLAAGGRWSDERWQVEADPANLRYAGLAYRTRPFQGEQHGGQPYSVSRLRTADPARVRGWLDASLRWRMSPRVTWAIVGQNLTRTLRRSDFGAASRPQNAFVNDRQVAASVSVQF